MLLGDDLLSLDLPYQGSPLNEDILTQLDFNDFPQLDVVARDVASSNQAKTGQQTYEATLASSPNTQGGFEDDLAAIDTDQLFAEWENKRDDLSVLEYLIEKEEQEVERKGHVSEASSDESNIFGSLSPVSVLGDDYTASANGGGSEVTEGYDYYSSGDSEFSLEGGESEGENILEENGGELNGVDRFRLETHKPLDLECLDDASGGDGIVLGVLDDTGSLQPAHGILADLLPRGDKKPGDGYMLLDVTSLVKNQQQRFLLIPENEVDHTPPAIAPKPKLPTSLQPVSPTLPRLKEKSGVKQRPSPYSKPPQTDRSDDVSVRRKGGRRKMPVEVKRERKKDQNRTAAVRYREKKKEEKGVAEQELSDLESRNRELRKMADELEREISCLKGLMRDIPELAEKAAALHVVL